jgi:hypothetical protein
MSDLLIVTETAAQLVETGAQDSIVTNDVQGDTVITSDVSITIITVEGSDSLSVEPETVTTVQVLTVGEQGPPGPGGGSGAGTDYETLLDFVSEDVVYRGDAVPGTAPEASAWRLSKLLTVPGGEVVIAHANGSTGFVHQWDARATYTY